MSILSDCDTALTETLDLWETVVQDDETSVQWLVLETRSGFVPVMSRHLLPEQEMTIGRTVER